MPSGVFSAELTVSSAATNKSNLKSAINIVGNSNNAAVEVKEMATNNRKAHLKFLTGNYFLIFAGYVNIIHSQHQHSGHLSSLAQHSFHLVWPLCCVMGSEPVFCPKAFWHLSESEAAGTFSPMRTIVFLKKPFSQR